MPGEIRDWGDEPPQDGDDINRKDDQRTSPSWGRIRLSTIAAIQGLDGEKDKHLAELRAYGLMLGRAYEIIEGLGHDLNVLWEQHKQRTETPELTRAEFLLETIEAGSAQAEKEDGVATILELGLYALGLI